MTGTSLTRDAASFGAEPPLQTPPPPRPTPGVLPAQLGLKPMRPRPPRQDAFAPPLLLDIQRPHLASSQLILVCGGQKFISSSISDLLECSGVSVWPFQYSIACSTLHADTVGQNTLRA